MAVGSALSLGVSDTGLVSEAAPAPCRECHTADTVKGFLQHGETSPAVPHAPWQAITSQVAGPQRNASGSPNPKAFGGTPSWGGPM